VKLDDTGSAVSSLRLDWQNDAGRDGEPYRSLREWSNNQQGWYGSYVRVLVPDDGELVTASGHTSEEDLRGVNDDEPEGGRLAFGNYLLMAPGASTMSYLWTTPGVAVEEDGTWTYHLDVQKQPGARPHEVKVRIDLPDGATVIEAPDGAVVDGDRVHVTLLLDRDRDVDVTYRLASDQPS
jgi:hypothetical protein